LPKLDLRIRRRRRRPGIDAHIVIPYLMAVHFSGSLSSAALKPLKGYWLADNGKTRILLSSSLT
jgi:hypothetical protein